MKPSYNQREVPLDHLRLAWPSRDLLTRRITQTMRQPWFATCFKWTCGICGFLVFGMLLSVVGYTLCQGIAGLSLDFLIKESSIGAGGGIFFQIIGSLILVAASAIIVVPMALSLGLVAHTSKSPALRRTIYYLMHILNGTPSIVFGILGFILFVKQLGIGKSWLAGSLILATMMLPTVTLSVANRLNTIPKHYVDTARALGLRPNALFKAIYIPYCAGGLLTGLVMGLARAFGETAPIMFTAVVFAGATWPQGIKDSPVLALPYHIFNLVQDFVDDKALVEAWATATVLVGAVFLLSFLAIPFRARSHEEANPRTTT